MSTRDDEQPIPYLDVVSLLVAACPTFRGSTQAAEADPDDGEYLLVGHIVSHVVQLLHEGDTTNFPALFGAVEQLLAKGDEEAQRLVVDGFLDDLANPRFYIGTPRRPTEFLQWLGPRARVVIAIDPDVDSSS